MLGDSLIKHENTIYIYNQKAHSLVQCACHCPAGGRWYPTLEGETECFVSSEIKEEQVL